MHYAANFTPLSTWKKIQLFSTNPPIFSKETQNLNALRIRTIPVAFCGSFATISYENILTFSSANKLPDVGVWRERVW